MRASGKRWGLPHGDHPSSHPGVGTETHTHPGVSTKTHTQPHSICPKAQRAGLVFQDMTSSPRPTRQHLPPHRNHLMPTRYTHHNITFIESRSLHFLHVENTFKKAGVL